MLIPGVGVLRGVGAWVAAVAWDDHSAAALDDVRYLFQNRSLVREGGMLMHPRISMVTLGVADVTRSRRFYEALGWSASGASTKDIAFFQLDGVVLALYGRAALTEDARLPDRGNTGGFGGVTLAQNVRSRADVDALLAQAEQVGARILKPAEDAFWGGYSGHFTDLDGHPWEVAWAPQFALTADGALCLPA
jgi:predicted lactoylglutathione lyase